MGLAKSLPPRGRGTALAVEGACVTLIKLNFIVTHSPSVAYGASSLPEGAYGRARASLGVWALPEAFVLFVLQMRN